MLCIGFDDYYKALEDFDVPADLKEKAISLGRKYHTIGNTMVLPFGLHQIRDTKPMGRGYLDVFLQAFYNMMIGAKRCNMKLLDAMNLKKKEVAGFRTEENYYTIVHGLMLEDFLDEEGKPKQVFETVFSWDKDLDRETYLRVLDKYIDFCESFIDRRADRIIEKLENILNSK